MSEISTSQAVPSNTPTYQIPISMILQLFTYTLTPMYDKRKLRFRHKQGLRDFEDIKGSQKTLKSLSSRARNTCNCHMSSFMHYESSCKIPLRHNCKFNLLNFALLVESFDGWSESVYGR